MKDMTKIIVALALGVTISGCANQPGQKEPVAVAANEFDMVCRVKARGNREYRNPFLRARRISTTHTNLPTGNVFSCREQRVQ